MPQGLIATLFFTVCLLMTHGYFLFGSVPLLILKHDTPLDARFVRGFFNTYYRVAMVIAAATAASLAWAGRPMLAASAVALALFAALLRRTILPKMDLLLPQIQANESGAISSFRRLHVAAIVLNLAQLATIVGILIGVSASMR